MPDAKEQQALSCLGNTELSGVYKLRGDDIFSVK